MQIIWQNLHHSELSPAQLYQILQLRAAVFVVEQNCIYQDLDGKDLINDNRHIMAWQNDTLIAYARILTLNQSQQSIGRVIVAKQARGLKLGYTLLAKAIDCCKQYHPEATIQISAQAHLQKFYHSMGFIAEGDVYDEDGIPHIAMYINPVHITS